MKQLEKEKAITLREMGGSIKEISRELKVSKSTASLWTRKVVLSRKARKIIQQKYTNGQLRAQEVRQAQTVQKLDNAARKAKQTIKGFPRTLDTCRVCCALLYWSEGTKSIGDREFTFTNSDPDLIVTFLMLFRASFKLDEKKFRVCVHLHDYHDAETQLQFWSKMTNIPLSQFTKPYFKPHTGKQRKEGYAGCAQIRYHDVVVAREIQAVARAFLSKYKGL